MHIGIFLDDERKPEDVTWVKYEEDIEWVIVRSYSEFVSELRKLFFNTENELVISFDHDLCCYDKKQEMN